MGKGKDIGVITNILIGDLNPKFNFLIGIALNQGGQRLRTVVACFHLDGNQIVLATDEEFFLKRGVLLLVIAKVVPRFHQSFRDDAFKETAFIDIEILILAKIHLGIVV